MYMLMSIYDVNEHAIHINPQPPSSLKTFWIHEAVNEY